MSIKAVSFDCAQTLVEVAWNPVEVAVESAIAAGVSLDPQPAGETYGRMLQTRWPEFQELNLQRSQEVCDGFWKQLGADWLERIGAGHDRLDDVVRLADHRCFGEGSTVFRLYPETVAALERIKALGKRLIVVSNWDVSLHRTLAMLNITDYFEVVVASLEEGVEKPEPAIFEVAKKATGLEYAEILHVGDDPVADVEGARRLGMSALLIDRNGVPSKNVVTDLLQVADRLESGEFDA